MPAPMLPGDPGYARKKFDDKKKSKGGGPGGPPGGPPASGPDMGAMEDAAGQVDGIMIELGMGPAGEGGEAGPEGGPEGGAPGEGGGDGSPGAVLAEKLGVSPEKGQELYDASQTMEALQGMSPEEVGDALEADMQLRMDVERISGQNKDAAPFMEADEMTTDDDAEMGDGGF